MPTLPTTRRMLLDQIPHHPLASLPPFTKFPHHRSIVGTHPFGWVFPRSSRRSREILEKTQTAVVAIPRLDGAQDVHRPELVELDVHGAVRDSQSWEKAVPASAELPFEVAAGFGLEGHLVHADVLGAG